MHDSLREDYTELLKLAEELEISLGSQVTAEEELHWEQLQKLQKRFADIRRIDFFHSPDATPVTFKVGRIKSKMIGHKAKPDNIQRTVIKDYQGEVWVTRPKPHVDRLACTWLIRRFIDPMARIHYSRTSASDEIVFDMPGATFGHHGN